MEKNLTLLPSSMLSTVSALGAQNMGAGKYDRADQILRCAMGIAVGFGVCVAVLIQFIAEPVVGLFTTDTMVAILCVRIPGVYLTSKFFPDTLFPMGLATATGSLLSVISCVIFFGWLKRREQSRKKMTSV